jgi:hypothetical protein
VPALLDNELGGVPDVGADPFTQVPGFEPAELRCVPDLHPPVLHGVPRTQPRPALGGRIRCFPALDRVPVGEPVMLVGVLGVDLLVCCQVSPRHVGVVGSVASFDVGVIGSVFGACFADRTRSPIVSLSARANSASNAVIIRACGCVVSIRSCTETRRPSALSNWSSAWPT